MKTKIYLLILCLLSTSFLLKAQLLIPEFDGATLLDDLSDQAEESQLFPFENGNALFFYRTYLKGEGEEIEILRQNIWFSYRDKGEWTNPDRLFRMGDYPGEIVIFGASPNAIRVYLLQTLYVPEKDSFKTELKYIEQNDKGRWSELKDMQIPGFEIGDRFASLYMNQTEDILFVSIAENANSQDEDLFVSLKSDQGEWSELIDLGRSINTSRPEMSAFIAADKRTLFFSSEGHRSYGGTDIFSAYRLDDSWTNWTRPKNLGDSINTEFYEDNFVALANGDYVFTSNRTDNVNDIYISHSEGSFNMNYGKGLAMANDQPASPSLAVKEISVYDHVQAAEDGSFDFMVRSKLEKVKFEVEENPTNKPLFIYKLSEAGEKISREVFNANGSEFSPHDQRILARLDCGGKDAGNQTVVVSDVNGYSLAEFNSDERGMVEILSDSIDRILNYTTDQDCILRDIRLIENGDLIAALNEEEAVINKDRLRTEVAIRQTSKSGSMDATTDADMSIYFAFNSITLSESEEQKLMRFADRMKADPSIKIKLTGFTDNIGTDEINMQIGKERAAYVRKLLSEAGIPASQILSKSMGESMPAASNQSEEGRAKNRRVEIVAD